MFLSMICPNFASSLLFEMQLKLVKFLISVKFDTIFAHNSCSFHLKNYIKYKKKKDLKLSLFFKLKNTQKKKNIIFFKYYFNFNNNKIFYLFQYFSLFFAHFYKMFRIRIRSIFEIRI